MDRIVIPAVPLRAHVGITETEREAAQDITVGVTLHLDLRPAGAADDLASTVDYEAVCETVAEIVRARHYHLIEAIAEEVAAAILARHSVAEVSVEVRKPGALAGRGVPYAAVEIHRHRGEMG